jgi:hypothetical protein
MPAVRHRAWRAVSEWHTPTPLFLVGLSARVSAQLVASKIIDETDAVVPHKKAAPVKW